MKLETFFEKFELFADAPDAVAKMRELVLQLAVQGKLVDQLPDDEPATMLLGRIEKTKQRLINERAIRRQDTEPISEDIAPFSIPESWVWTRLGEIGDWGSGSTPARGNHELYGGGITWLKSGELNDNQALTGSSETVTDLALKTGSFRRNQPGDVLFAMYGATIGKVAILAESAVTNQAVCGCTPFEGISNRYLFNYLLSQRTAFHAAGEGGAQPNLSKVKIVAFPFPLPCLAEQKRIVAKVDELMALCDRLEAQQQERETRQAALARASLARFADAPTPENLNFLFHPSYTITPADLRKSILTLAVQGKLVPQDPKDESAAELLAGIAGDIAKAVRAKRVRNSRHIPPHEGEFPFELPVGWAWAPLVNLTVAEDGAMCDGPFGSKLKTEHYIPTKGYAVLRLGNIGVGYFIHGKEGHISREHFESLPSNHCAPGDLLVAGLADPLVRCCEIPPDMGPAVNKSDCFRVRLSKRMERSYVRHYLNSPIAKAFAAEENHGMTRERINLASAKALPVPVPPFAEQRRIVTKVEQLLALVDALETQLAASRATAANLLSTLVAELTGNPNNRHASVSPATGSGRRGRPRKI